MECTSLQIICNVAFAQETDIGLFVTSVLFLLVCGWEFHRRYHELMEIPPCAAGRSIFARAYI